MMPEGKGAALSTFQPAGPGREALNPSPAAARAWLMPACFSGQRGGNAAQRFLQPVFRGSKTDTETVPAAKAGCWHDGNAVFQQMQGEPLVVAEAIHMG